MTNDKTQATKDLETALNNAFPIGPHEGARLDLWVVDGKVGVLRATSTGGVMIDTHLSVEKIDRTIAMLQRAREACAP